MIELIIYVGFVALLSVVLVNLILIGNRQEFQNEEKQFLREATVTLFEQLQEDVDLSSFINTPLNGAESATLNLTVSGQAILYELSEGRITRQIGAGNAVPITPSVVTISNLNFGNYSVEPSPGSVTVSFMGNDEFFNMSFSRNDE